MSLTIESSFLWNETVWNPSMISTELWLDANDSSTITQSGGAVTTWRDKSGKNRTATAAGNPTYSTTGMSTSKPAVQLDGTGDWFVSSITGIGSFNALDVYMVTQTTTAATVDTNSAIFWGYGNIAIASGPYPASRSITFFSGTNALTGETIATGTENSSFNAGRLGSSSYTRNANTAQILQSVFDTTGTTVRANASPVTLDLAYQITSTTNAAPSNIGYAIDSDLHIGALRANGSILPSLAIKFGEFIVLSSTASTQVRQRVEGYLAHKWGLEANLPAGHPYKNYGPKP